MQLEQMTPEDLIRPSWLTQYEKEMTAIWWKLVRLSSNLFILKKVDCFPFDLFAPIPQPFWILVRYSLFDTSAMIIWASGVGSQCGRLNASEAQKQHCAKPTGGRIPFTTQRRPTQDRLRWYHIRSWTSYSRPKEQDPSPHGQGIEPRRHCRADQAAVRASTRLAAPARQSELPLQRTMFRPSEISLPHPVSPRGSTSVRCGQPPGH